MGYSPRGHKELDTTEVMEHTLCIGTYFLYNKALYTETADRPQEKVPSEEWETKGIHSKRRSWSDKTELMKNEDQDI